MTFDGGPTSQYTPKVLAQLRKAKLHVTFFIRGQFIKGHTGLLRQALADGHEFANHSYSHPHFPGSYEISRTTALIRKAVEDARGNVALAAQQLGVSRATVYRKLGIKRG